MDENRFGNQVAIVTGAGTGAGFEIARQLALSGAKVLLNDIDLEFANRAASVINLLGGNCYPLPGNAADLDFIQKMVDTAVTKFGFLTIVVANAEVTAAGDFIDYSPEDFQKIVNVNLFGGFFLAQRAAIQIKKQQSAGSILMMSAVAGRQAHKNLAAYSITKAGLEMLAKSLVLELSPYQITVNAVAPGATLTERTAEVADYESMWSRITPLGRPASVEDIANAVLFLISPEARHITGQCLVVDGGWSVAGTSVN